MGGCLRHSGNDLVCGAVLFVSANGRWAAPASAGDGVGTWALDKWWEGRGNAARLQHYFPLPSASSPAEDSFLAFKTIWTCCTWLYHHRLRLPTTFLLCLFMSSLMHFTYMSLINMLSYLGRFLLLWCFVGRGGEPLTGQGASHGVWRTALLGMQLAVALPLNSHRYVSELGRNGMNANICS